MHILIFVCFENKSLIQRRVPFTVKISTCFVSSMIKIEICLSIYLFIPSLIRKDSEINANTKWNVNVHMQASSSNYSRAIRE